MFVYLQPIAVEMVLIEKLSVMIYVLSLYWVTK